MLNYVLTPIAGEPVKPLEKLQVKCFTCSHYTICNLRLGYLKIAKLIHNMFQPAEQYLIAPLKPFGDFNSGTLVDPELVPETIKKATGEVGRLYQARFFGETDTLKLIYLFNGVEFLMCEYSYINDIVSQLNNQEGNNETTMELSSEQNIIAMAIENADEIEIPFELTNSTGEYVNSTYFSAALNCSFYAQVRGITYSEAINKLLASYPNGIPMENGEYYNLATYTYTPEGEGLYNPMAGVPVLAPFPLPKFPREL